MSASRVKVGKLKPKKNPLPVKDDTDPLLPTTVSRVVPPSKPKKQAPAPIPRKEVPQASSSRIVSTTTNSSSNGLQRKGAVVLEAGKASKPISIASSDEDEDEDDEDDFEEVPIPGPSTAGPSSMPGTPGYTGTAGTQTPGGTTAGETADEAGGYAYGSSSEDEQNAEEDGIIRVEFGGETAEEKAKRIALAMRKKPLTSKDRAIRLEAHKLHVIALLASARVRNRWASNALLKARLLSLLPHPLVSAFSIPPSRFPDRAQRSRLFFDALQSLVTWWSQVFFDIPDYKIGQRTRPWDEVQAIVDKLPQLKKSDWATDAPAWIIAESSSKDKGKGKGKDDDPEWMKILEENSGNERLRTVNSLMKKALQQEGSRDVSSILFVSLARACGLGARLVVSIQPVPWRAEKVVVKKKSGAGKGGRSVASRQGVGNSSDEDEDEDDELEEVPIPGIGESEGAPAELVEKIKNGKSVKRGGTRAAGRRRLQDPADFYRLRKPKPAPQTTGTSPAKPKTSPKLDLSHQPPVFWAEIFSRSDQRWVPVDPIRGTIRKKGHFEPPSDNGPIRLTYVVGFEEDGYARDVTLRYAKSFGAKTSKIRVPIKKDEPDWWAGVIRFMERPNRLHRDELEDAELETSQVSEAMPVHLNGFKDHPIYVLERHLKREEVLHPKREVGRFRGEPVFRRVHVQSCKTAENWMRVGRKVKPKHDPMKWVKQRAVTLQKRRQQELAKQDGEEILQGLYAEWQTEVYTPPPIQDGVIPQNSFGNIDLYAPTMLPKGAIHLPYKGIAKIAKQLGISYAEACTGFEFKKQRAIPVITGIVVAAENEALVLDAYFESAAAQEERERVKAEDRALKRWAKLINGLRVRKRLQAEYGNNQDLQSTSFNPLAAGAELDPMTVQEQRADAEKEAKGKRTVKIILNAGKAGKKAYEQMMQEKEDEDSEDEDMEEVKVEQDTADPVPPVMGFVPVVAIDEEESEEELEEVETGNPELSNGVPNKPAPATVDPKVDFPVSRDATSINGHNSSRPSRKAAASKKRIASQSPESGDIIIHSHKTTRPTRQKAAKKQAPPPQINTRSLRSRDPKSKEKQIEDRARIRKALEMDSEEEDEE